MKKSYTVPAAELIYLLPQEDLASGNKSWIWKDGKGVLSNLWGNTKDNLMSATVNWYDIDTNEFTK